MSCLSVGRWWAWDGIGVAVRVACAPPADLAALTRAEAALVATRGFTPERRHAWIRGRALARHALGLTESVLVGDDGAPRVAGDRWRVGFSHDGPWTAVIACRSLRAARVVTDVAACEPARAARALARVRVDAGRGVDPVAAWSALECAIKLRGRHVGWLLDRRVAVAVAAGGALAVRGVGAPLVVRIARLSGATICWSDGSPP